MFNPGDVVQLKSGGQAMTVVKEQDNGDVELVWQDSLISCVGGNYILNEGEMHMGVFMPCAVLKPYVSSR